MGTIESLTSLAMIFVMIIPGLFLGRKNIVTEDQTAGLTTVVVNLTWPCLIIDSMQMPFSFEILKNSGFVTVIMLVIFVISYLISLLIVKFVKMDKSHRHLFTFMIMFANTGFMGIPIINAVYGEEATFYAAIYEMVANILIFTVGIMLIQMAADKNLRMHPRELLTPGLIAVIIGFLLFVLGITLPGFLGKSVYILGAATTPITMVAIGTMIGRMKVKDIFSSGTIYLMSFITLIIIPAITYLLLFVIMGESSLLAKVLVIDFAMPAAMCSAIFSRQYGADYEFASKGVMISTMLSMVTIPLFTILLSF